MKNSKKLRSVALASAIMILFLILVSSTASAATEQSASSVAQYAYITNINDGTVSVIDTATDTVTATVNVGNWPHGIAVNPDGTKVYVGNSRSDTVSVIDTATNAVIDTVPVESGPAGVAVNPEGTKVYVTNSGSNTVSVIDTATNTITATVPVGSYPFGITVTPDGTRVYLVNVDSQTVSVIDTATNTVTATVPVGGGPVWITMNPGGTKVYVTNQISNTVSVIDTATNTVTTTVNVGDFPEGIAVNPAGTRVYVANRYSNTVSVVDTATNTVTATVDLGSYPCGVGFIPDGTKVYVANTWDNTVSVIDTATNTVTATVNVGTGPVALGQFIFSVHTQEPVLPVANFSSNITEGYAPLTVQFTDFSQNATGWDWNFGDEGTSTEKNPMHTFSAAGNYTVNLTVSNENGTDSKLATINVSEKPVLPVANFSAIPTSGTAPLNVSFTDYSKGSPTAWKWSFGDGVNSTEQNPTHTYSKAGNYTVVLTASNFAGSSKITKPSYIKVKTVIRPAANFTSNVTSGFAPLNVAFTDKSTGVPTAWKWSFGDGMNSTEQNPTHKYSKEGNYTVVLTASNSAGSSKTTKPSYIKVKPATRPVSNFTSNVTSGYAPLDVSFIDNSSGLPTAWNWSFGDGINSTEQNPMHTYSKAGNYTVVLTASNSAGSSKITKPSYIKVIKS